MTADIDSIPSPLFLISDEGRITLYLPAFEGEPNKAVLKFHDKETLKFIRSETSDVLLTGIDADVMIELSKASRILVMELDSDKCIDVTQAYLEAQIDGKEFDGDVDEESLCRYAYEANVSF